MSSYCFLPLAQAGANFVALRPVFRLRQRLAKRASYDPALPEGVEGARAAAGLEYRQAVKLADALESATGLQYTDFDFLPTPEGGGFPSRFKPHG